MSSLSERKNILWLRICVAIFLLAIIVLTIALTVAYSYHISL
ncbi:hypothetical protein [Chitinophaga eiseniae]|nr:hypothetical protein [Chitinophaga eiseniae]